MAPTLDGIPAGLGPRTFNVSPAPVTISATGGTFPFDGLTHGATGTASGALDPSLSPVTFTYNGDASTPIHGGTYSAIASYAGNTHYAAASSALGDA